MQQTRAPLAVCMCVCVCVGGGVGDVRSRSEEQGKNLINSKCQWFTNAAVGTEVWHFAYKITYRD
jgi:hypothetical protein